MPKLQVNEKEKLLADYAPELRFSRSERFFPMDVRAYISACPTIYKGNRLLNNIGWEQKNIDQRLAYLRGEGRSIANNLHFLPGPAWRSTRPRLLLAVLILFLVVSVIIGICMLAKPYPALAFDVWIWVKVVFLAASIVVWPFVDADSRVHLGVLINLSAAFFFGTIFALGFGLLAVALAASFWGAYLVFKFGGRTWEGLEKRLKSFMTRVANWKLPVLHGLSLFFLTFSGILAGYLVEVTTPAPPGMPVIIASTAFTFYFLMWIGPAVIRNVPRARISIFLLSFMALPVIALHWLAAKAIVDPRSVYVAIVFISGVTILWYALYPLPITRASEMVGGRIKMTWSWRGLLVITLTVLVYLGLGIVFLLNFNPYRPDQVIAVVFLHLLVLVLGILVTLIILGTRVVSYVLDVFSGLYNTDADLAFARYQEIRETEAPYRCYGRVTQRGNWVTLTYDFFYAFNDFRSNAGGMNNHEGDWEAIAVFLRLSKTPEASQPYVPFGVAYSQHHHGAFRFWEHAEKTTGNGVLTSHPVAYIALGSHANYPERGSSPPSMQLKGAVRSAVNAIENVVRFFHTETWLKLSAPTESTGSDDHPGNGLCIGTSPAWKIEMIDDDTDWIQYKGLWGRASWISGESGPQGPKWDGTHTRLRWGSALLDMLLIDLAHDEQRSVSLRVKALRELVGRDDVKEEIA